MSRSIFKLTDSTGATRFLSLATSAEALYSVDGKVWLPIPCGSTDGDDSGSGEYSYGYGLVIQGTEVSIDTSIVPVLTDGAIPSKYIPNVPQLYGNGLALVDGLLSVTTPNSPGSIVVVDDEGKIPNNLLPNIKVGTGLQLDSNGSVSVITGVNPGDLVVVGANGKIDATLLPDTGNQGTIEYVGGEGIRVSGNTISEIWEDYR